MGLFLTMEFRKKLKVDSERRTFNKDWMPKCFFTEIDNKGVCLLCNQSVAVFWITECIQICQPEKDGHETTRSVWVHIHL